jgi:hypothetical protein
VIRRLASRGELPEGFRAAIPVSPRASAMPASPDEAGGGSRVPELAET